MAYWYRRDLAVSFNNLGMAQRRDGRTSEAETSFQKAAQLQETLLASLPTDAETRSNQASVYNNLGVLYDQQKRYADAEKSYRQAIENQRHALDVSPESGRYRALLGRYYLNLTWNLDKQSKYDAAVAAAVERKRLWLGNANQLYSVAQQLANTYDLMRIAASGEPSRAACVTAAVDTLREAVTAGLPVERLKDSSLASLAGTGEFRKLIEKPSTLSRSN